MDVLIPRSTFSLVDCKTFDLNIIDKLSSHCKVTPSLILEAAKKYFGKKLLNYDLLRTQILNRRREIKKDDNFIPRAKPGPSYFKLNGFGFVEFVMSGLGAGKIRPETASNLLFKRGKKNLQYLNDMSERLRNY